MSKNSSGQNSSSSSSTNNKMYVVKRNGTHQEVHFDKVTKRIQRLCEIEPPIDTNYVNVYEIAQKVILGIFPGVKTTQLDNLAAETAAYSSARHPDFDALAARISVSNLHKQTIGNLLDVFSMLYNYQCPQSKKVAPLVSKMAFDFVQKNSKALMEAIEYRRDYKYSYFGFKTLERAYLLRCDKLIVERPQDLLMRVAVGIHMIDVNSASIEENAAALQDCLETYYALSTGLFTHATPTLFSAGTPKPQMSSCFLVQMREDSIEGIYDTLKQCALISKYAGGIGLAMSKIRARDSFIAGTNGNSNGIVPMLRVYNDTARYVDQGGGKRKGSFAMYLEPWHADVFDFLDLKKNHGSEELRARDLFYALWMPDLFMQRVEANADWSLFCPNEAPGLDSVYGAEFNSLYERYESENRARRVVKAQALWKYIVESQIETGSPYILFKDACNSKSNQKNLGTITGSNLCTEIIQYTSKDEIAVCNLASIALPKFVNIATATFDHMRFAQVVKMAVRNLNKIIDLNFYPLPETRNSNMQHRPIGLGVQGLADVFMLLKMPFVSDAAKKLNREIFETMYYAAVEQSCNLARQFGPYASYSGSPMSRGEFQFDMWGEKPESERESCVQRYDWQALRRQVMQHGVRNSLLVAPMPTASTSQILGNNECIEPYTSNCYTRRVLAGDFVVANEHLVRDLLQRGLWSDEMKQDIIRNRGSVQNIASIPDDMKKLYKTVWEIKQRDLIDMAADRAIYICQSQSFNLFLEQPNYAQLTSSAFYSWRKGMKCGNYYIRTLASADPIQFTVEKKVAETTTAVAKDEETFICLREQGCVTCSS